jgi:hypothetical protein
MTSWTSTTGYRNYANVTSIQRKYGVFPIDPELNFPPGGFRRALGGTVSRRNLCGSSVRCIESPIRSHGDPVDRIAQRGIPTRLITEQLQYRDESRLWTRGTSTACGWPASRTRIAGGSRNSCPLCEVTKG